MKLLQLAEISRNENFGQHVGQLQLLVAMFVCSYPAARSSRAVFAKLYTQVDIGPGKNRLGLQGHGIKDQGHTATTIEIL